MVSTPNFEELKEACGSNRLEHCFRFLFMQEASENEGFIRLLDEKCDDVRHRMQKRRELINEGQKGFSVFDPVSGDGLQCMQEAQYTDGQILAALMHVLDLAREAMDEKHTHVEKMEQYG